MLKGDCQASSRASSIWLKIEANAMVVSATRSAPSGGTQIGSAAVGVQIQAVRFSGSIIQTDSDPQLR
jgi:hypothetical protein